jgi:hypothetical protein
MAVAVTGPKGSSTTGATTGDAIAGPPRSRAPLVAIIATVLVAGAGAAVFLARGGAKPAPEPQPATVVTNAPPAATSEAITLSPAPSSPPPAADTTALAPAASSSAHAPPSHAGPGAGHATAASPAPAATKAAAAAPPPPSPPAASAPPPAPAPKAAANCNPPYVIDSAGHRQYKPECL